MFLFNFFLYVVDCGRVLLKREFIVVVKRHFFLMVLAPEIDKCFNDFQFEIGRRKAIIVLNSDMYDKLASESADSHGLDVGVRDFPFDPTEQSHKGGRFQIVQIAISKE